MKKQIHLNLPWDLWEEIQKVGESWEQETGKRVPNQKLVRMLVRMGLKWFKLQSAVPDKEGRVPVVVMVSEEVMKGMRDGQDVSVSVGYRGEFKGVSDGEG